MKVLRYKSGFRIFYGIAVLLLSLCLLFLGILFFIYESSHRWTYLICFTFLSLIFALNVLTVLSSRLEYDSEKLVSISFGRRTEFYYKDIIYFGRKNSGNNLRPRYSYWLLKTKEKSFQPEIQVSTNIAELNDFLDTMKSANPQIVMDV